MIIYGHIGKRKKRKPSLKERELQNSWNELMKQTKPKKSYIQTISQPKDLVLKNEIYRRETVYYNSLNSRDYNTFKKETKYYTGDKMKGIGTLHKSNAVPVFTDEEARDQANMRR
jgi:hypothetical protein